MSDTPRISVTMALDALEEQCDKIDEIRALLARELAIRDDMIRDARSAKVPEKTLCGRSRLSRDSIGRIAASASRGVSDTTKEQS